MNLKICLIDDDLLKIERKDKFFSEYQIQANVSNIAPDDAEVQEYELNLKSFIQSMLEDEAITLYGYTNPISYNNNIGNQPAFDVVIYDWEYGPTGTTINSEDELEKLVKESHCFVYIYSHMEDVATQALIEEIKSKYPHRIDFLKKGESNSAVELRDQIRRLKSGNFSATFSHQLRVNASKSVEKILVKLAHLDIEKFNHMMGTNDEEKKKDLVEFISEKFKNELMQMSFSLPPVEAIEEVGSTTAPETVGTVSSPEEPSIKELWHYRMYSTITDDRVRKGDIYKKESSEDYLLIMTPNCQLVSYHDNKTFGILNFMHMVPTSILRETVDRLVNRQSENRQTIINFKPKKANSLINQVAEKDSAPFVLPYVVIREDSEDDNLVLFPKMYGYQEIQALKKSQKNYLKKSELEGYMYITSLNEPFLNELTNEIYNKLQGNGVPDYTSPVKEEIFSLMDTVSKS